MASINPINIQPLFRTTQLPCEGRVGDMLVISPLAEDEPDFSNAGVASIWICTRAYFPGDDLPAVWVRLQPDGYATCQVQVPDPPQDLPPVSEG